MPDALLAVRHGTIVWAEGATAEVLGVPSEALVGQPVTDRLAPGEWERLLRLVAQRDAGWELPATCRLRFVRPEASPVTVDVRFAIDGEGDDRLLVLSARDLTDLARAEDLIARLARLPAGDQLVDGPALLDAAEPILGALRWKGAFIEVVEGGSITRRMLGGAPVGDPVGDYARSLVDKLKPIAETPLVAEVVRTRQAVFLDNLPTFEDGPRAEARALADSLSGSKVARSAWCPVFVGGKLTHVLSLTGAGMTEHDFVALQLFAAQIGAAIRLGELRTELVWRERLAAVGEMAALLAHEVRNPLGVIFNAVSGLRKRVSGDANASGLVDILSEEADRLSRLVRDLLDFSRHSQPTFVAVAVRPVLEEALDAARHDLGVAEVQAEVEVVVGTDVPPVRADASVLRRALVNMVVNALQHVTAKGKVTLSAERSGAEVRIRVVNDGPALPPELAARVFDPFFTTRSSGTGLGLAVVRRSVEDLRGRVTLDPWEGRVSFSLWLAADDAAGARRTAS